MRFFLLTSSLYFKPSCLLGYIVGKQFSLFSAITGNVLAQSGRTTKLCCQLIVSMTLGIFSWYMETWPHPYLKDLTTARKLTTLWIQSSLLKHQSLGIGNLQMNQIIRDVYSPWLEIEVGSNRFWRLVNYKFRGRDAQCKNSWKSWWESWIFLDFLVRILPRFLPRNPRICKILQDRA